MEEELSYKNKLNKRTDIMVDKIYRLLSNKYNDIDTITLQVKSTHELELEKLSNEFSELDENEQDRIMNIIDYLNWRYYREMILFVNYNGVFTPVYLNNMLKALRELGFDAHWNEYKSITISRIPGVKLAKIKK